MPANTTATLELNAIDNVSAVVQRVTGTVGDLQRSYERLADVVKVLAGGIGVGYFLSLIKGSIDASAHLQDLSKSTGLSAEQLAGLSLLGKQTGTDLDGLAKGIDKMSVAMGKSPEKFRDLGISAKDPLEALKQFAEIFKLLPDIQQRNALAQAVFAKSWAELAPVLSLGGQRIGEVIERGTKLSGVTDEVTQQAKAFNDRWVELTGTGAVLTRLIGPMLPLLNMLAEDMLNAGEKADGLTKSISPLAEMLKLVVVLGAEFSFVWQTIGKDIARAIENVKLIAAGDFAGSRALGETFRKDAAAAREALDAYTATVMGTGLTGKAAPGAPTTDPAAAAAAAARAAAFLRDAKLVAAELKLFTSSVQGLEKEYFHLTSEGKLTTIMWEEQHGSLQRLTPAHKEELLAMADKLDAYKHDTDMRKMVIIGIQAEEAARTHAAGVLESYVLANRAAANDQQFQLTLIGKSARELESLNAARKIDLELRRAVEALPMDSEGNMLTGSSDALDALRANAEIQKRIILAGIQARQDAERSWLAGTKTAFDTYIGDATNAAVQASMLFTNAFRNMEDGLVNFVKTGKLDFRSLADSIITDLIRIQVRQGITAPLAGMSKDMFSGMGSAISDFFGGNFAAGGTLPANTWNVVGESGPEMVWSGPGGGNVVPNGAMGGGDMLFAIDARGADRAGLAQLSAAIARVNGSIEGRVLQTVRKAFNDRGASTPWG